MADFERTYGKTVAWLLDSPDVGVRYLAMRDLFDLGTNSSRLEAAKSLAYQQGQISIVLEAMHPDGYWVEPGPGYLPKYKSSVWALILLAQLGASIQDDVRIARACDYLVAHALTPSGQFTATGAPSGTADCLQGNLCWSLMTLGYGADRLSHAYEWMARTVTGDGIAPVGDRSAQVRFFAGKCGPLFACGANDKKSCAWGAVKVMMAFSCYPMELRTPIISRAVEAGIDFLLDHQPAQAGYPNGYSDKPSSNWWKFGFPVFYVTDLLQIVEAGVLSGVGKDRRLSEAVQLITGKQNELGQWILDYDYAGKTYGYYGVKRQPNPWVTLRALRVLKLLG